MSTTRIQWKYPYKPQSSATVWHNTSGFGGWEIRLDALNRFNVYKVTIEYSGYRKAYWIVTRVPWAIVPTYVHYKRNCMAAVLRVIAERET